MFVMFRKIALASLIMLIVLTMGAWQSSPVSTEKQTTPQVETPLYPGFTWSSLGSSVEKIRINTQGGTISVSGERFKAQEQFPSYLPLPEDLANYYSNAELAKSGWASYDAFDNADGIHYVFYHESGVYLSVEFVACQNDSGKTCVAIWKSVPVEPQVTASSTTNAPENLASASTFGKISPTNGATGISPTNAKFQWGSYSAALKYAYCVDSSSDCVPGSVNWTGTYDTSETRTDLTANKTYHWQVRALLCDSCTTKWLYANGGNSWTFSTSNTRITIAGNAGVGGATLSYVDGTAKKVTADVYGTYTINVPVKWSGTITPSKTGYLFTPASASFTNVTTNPTIQNFTAIPAYTISGNVGISGATLSYINGTPKTVVSDSSGNYSILVPTGWNGTVTPSKIGYSFAPVSRTYTNVVANQASQNYKATYITFTVSGNAGIAGATLTYTDTTVKKVVADGSGNYSIVLPLNWSGTITPTKLGYTFAPVNRTYSGLNANQTAQNYTATLITYTVNGNAGIAGATLYYVDGTMKSVVADGSGNYSITLPYGWTGSVTPYKTGSTFTPVNRAYTYLLSNQGTQNYVAQACVSCADVNIAITSVVNQNHTIPSGGRITPTFPGIQTGPVKVSSSTPVFASERALYGPYNTFNEVMGMPDGQVTDHYWFPWYDNQSMKTWILVANPSTSLSADVTIKIAGIPVYSKTLAHGEIATPTFPIKNGPVEVTSTNPIIASERALAGPASSFNEVMGIPNGQLTDHYWFPWYDNVNMKTWILVANPDGINSTTVTIKIAGQQVYSKTLLANEIVTPTFAMQNGPVEVTSTNPVITSERVLYGPYSTFNEVMGVPNGQLTDHYWFPWYDNKDMSTKVLVANPDGLNSASVTIKVAGQVVYSKTLLANQVDNPTFGTTQGGPVEILSTRSIITSERAVYGPASSFNEVMGFPNTLLTTDYWFTWYDGKAMKTWVLVGKP